jgi:hypothetical protein
MRHTYALVESAMGPSLSGTVDAIDGQRLTVGRL